MRVTLLYVFVCCCLTFLIFGSFWVYLCAGVLVMNRDLYFIFWWRLLEICACLTSWQCVCTHASVNVCTHLVMDRYFNLCVFFCVIKLDSYYWAIWCPLLFCVNVIMHICSSLCVCLCLKPGESSFPLIKAAIGSFNAGVVPMCIHHPGLIKGRAAREEQPKRPGGSVHLTESACRKSRSQQPITLRQGLLKPQNDIDWYISSWFQSVSW